MKNEIILVILQIILLSIIAPYIILGLLFINDVKTALLIYSGSILIGIWFIIIYLKHIKW
jgi:hypothetical protein